MANKKFSEFTTKTATSDIDFVVGYDGTDNVKFTPSRLKVIQTMNAFDHSSNNVANFYYFPFNTNAEVTSATYQNAMTAAYSGRVAKIILSNSDQHDSPTATSTKFEIQINNTVVHTSAFISHSAELGVSISLTLGETDVTFSEGDSIRVGFNTNGLWHWSLASIVLEYN